MKKAEIKECYEILTEFNKYRRGEGDYGNIGSLFKYSPKEIGIAIDTALNILGGLFKKTGEA